MANETQDFNIKVVTTADTTGLKQTRAEMEALRQQAEKIKQDAGATALFARVPPGGIPAGAAAGAAAGSAGLAATAAGIGTITYALTIATRQWTEFIAEQDRWVDGMIKATEKARELGEAILDIQDKARDAARVGTEPLEQSFIRLQLVIIRLKTEMNLLDLPTQGEEWKKLAHDVSIAEAQLKGVTSELQRNAAAAEKAAESEEKLKASFLKGAVETASPQTQAVLKNEEAARKAREAGDQKSADMYQKSADQLKASMSQAQREEYEGLIKPIRLGPKAGPGESQAALDEIARNKINFDRQLKGEPPLPPQSSAGGAGGNQDIIQAMREIWGY